MMQARGLSTGGTCLRLGMSVYGIDLVRGLSVAVYAVQDEGQDAGVFALTELFREVYRKEPFVRVRDWQSEAVPLPDPKAVIGSNYCDVAAFHDTEAGRVVVIAALDNLMKGAAGQAVQACNIRYGLPETQGLSSLPIYPA
jgi:LysW-gamma-L-alpha-aminoadipyl-6-phosphate/LysW-L-glutamyl-5-phosphate reductase